LQDEERDRDRSEEDLEVQRIASRMALRDRTWSEESRLLATSVGKFWKGIRRQKDRTRQETAIALGVHNETMLLFEEGLLHHSDLPSDFIIRLALFLDAKDELTEHIRRFEKDYLTYDPKKKWDPGIDK